MEGQRRLELHGGCLWADGRRAEARVFASMCRALAVLSIEKGIQRLLIDATGCEPEGAQTVRDAFTVMILAGMPADFRVALVANAAAARHGWHDVVRDLRRLHVNVKLFDEVDAAADWLACTATDRPGSHAVR